MYIIYTTVSLLGIHFSFEKKYVTNIFQIRCTKYMHDTTQSVTAIHINYETFIVGTVSAYYF